MQRLLKEKNYSGLNMELLEVIYPLKSNRDVPISNFQIGSGTYNYIPGEFSSGKNSKSNKIDYKEGYVPDHSQDIVIAITGALSDPLPESNAHEVFREMLRVIKSGGKLVIGTYITWDPYEISDEEIERIRNPSLAKMQYVQFRKVVSDVLKEKEWVGRVRINLNNVDAQDFGFHRFSIFEVSFAEPVDSNARKSAEIGQAFDADTDSAGSPIAVVPKGGIAFNALPIQTEAVASSALGAFPAATVFNGDLDTEWARIQAVYNAGIRPSIQRLSEYAAAAATGSLAQDKIDQVRVMLADILRRDEESQKLAPAEESCKQLLKLLESG